MNFIAKTNWKHDDPISENDLNRWETGIDDSHKKSTEIIAKLAETETKVNKITPVIQATQPTDPFEGMVWLDTSKNRTFIDTFEAVNNTIPNQRHFSVLKRNVPASGGTLSADSDIRIQSNKLNMKAKDTDQAVGSGIDAYVDTTLLFNTPVDLLKGDITVEFDSVMELTPAITSILRSFEVRFCDVKSTTRSGESMWTRVNFADGNLISVSSWSNNTQTTDPSPASNQLDGASHKWRILFRKADKRVLVYKDGIQILITGTNFIPLTLGFVELVCTNKNNGAAAVFTEVNIDNLTIKYTD